MNNGCEDAIFVAAFNDEDPGVDQVAQRCRFLFYLRVHSLTLSQSSVFLRRSLVLLLVILVLSRSRVWKLRCDFISSLPNYPIDSQVDPRQHRSWYRRMLAALWYYPWTTNHQSASASCISKCFAIGLQRTSRYCCTRGYADSVTT
jgi:hypothetical protein